LLVRPVRPSDDEKERRLTDKSSDQLDVYIDAVSNALALSIDDAWRPAVRANLEVSLRLARLVDEFPLPDETESASVYTA
jgi:Protein of unknown function (DUF4089)